MQNLGRLEKLFSSVYKNNLKISPILFIEQHVSSPQTSANTSETYSPSSTSENHPTSDRSFSDSPGQSESARITVTPPEEYSLKLEGITSTPNLVTSVQRTDVASPVQPICEGSFVGRARHKDGSLLGIVFQVPCSRS